MALRKMKHEAVARDLARRAYKLATKQSKKCEQEVTINMVSFYIRLNGDKVEFWSADKCCEAPVTATETEMYHIFLDVLNRTVSKSFPIDYIV